LEGGRDGFVKPVGSSSWNATEANALEELFLVSSVHDTVDGLMNQAITRDGKNTIILAKRDAKITSYPASSGQPLMEGQDKRNFALR